MHDVFMLNDTTVAELNAEQIALRVGSTADWKGLEGCCDGA